MACCIRYQHPNSTGATCQPSNAERECRHETAAQIAQEDPPPVPGLRGRWESFEGRRHWLGLGDGAPPPSDGPPAQRSSRLQQQGHLHPGNLALLAALRCSLAEMPAAHLAPQATVGSHRAGESSCSSPGAADLGWLDLPPGQASLHLQRVQATWPPGCQLPAQATAGDGGLCSIPTTSGIALHCSAVQLQDSKGGPAGARQGARCHLL